MLNKKNLIKKTIKGKKLLCTCDYDSVDWFIHPYVQTKFSDDLVSCSNWIIYFVRLFLTLSTRQVKQINYGHKINVNVSYSLQKTFAHMKAQLRLNDYTSCVISLFVGDTNRFETIQ